MRIIDIIATTELSKAARRSDRKRKNLNYHSYNEDPVQRMLNAFEPNTYVQPHTHVNPDKREVFLILTGKLLVIFFNDKGDIIDHIVLDRDAGIYGVEIQPGEWHTATGLEKGTVVFEVKDGPYNVSSDKNFAEWAPNENNSNSIGILKEWLLQLNLSIL